MLTKCGVCEGVIIGTVHTVFLGNIMPFHLCGADFILGSEEGKHLTDEEILGVIRRRANPFFRGSATRQVAKAMAAFVEKNREAFDVLDERAGKKSKRKKRKGGR